MRFRRYVELTLRFRTSLIYSAIYEEEDAILFDELVFRPLIIADIYDGHEDEDSFNPIITWDDWDRRRRRVDDRTS